MRRLLFTLALMPLVAMMAPGQSALRPLAADQVKLFRANRELLEDLVQHTVELAKADTPVARAKACLDTTQDLGRAMQNAIAVDDAERVAELSEYLAAVIAQSLQPTIDEGRRVIPVGTPAERDLAAVRSQAVKDTQIWENAIPAIGKIGTSAKVRTAREYLQKATSEFRK
jgi:hypothetical protein